MNKMHEDQQEEIKKLLTDHQWTHAVTIHAREPTWGSLWLSITDGFQKICIDNPDLKYWVVGARGSLNDAPHYHGVVYWPAMVADPEFARKQMRKYFREVNHPYVKPIKENLGGLAGWLDYIANQAVNETTITNIGEE